MKALLILDIQKDFLPGGALAVPSGNEVIEFANLLIKKFETVVAMQDWHPANHKSFASNNQGKKQGDLIILKGLPQVLWPDHCVQGSDGAEFSKQLDVNGITKIIRKGTDPGIDSYSGFFDNGRLHKTDLDKYLRSIKIDEIFMLGLATDYCVKFTCLDALDLGYKVSIIIDACRGIDLNPGDIDLAVHEMILSGARVVKSDEIE
jgi:nicotinamidase/pyrazinamidase